MGRYDNTQVTFEREALYKEVWEVPLSRLGPKYGLSDNGLRKVCKAMNIPLPVAGHWARVHAGHNVERTGLPVEAERTTFTSYLSPTPEEGIVLSEDAVWLREKLAFEDAPENKIVCEAEPQRWHRTVIETRNHVRKQAVAYAKAMKADEESKKRRAKPGVWSGPDFSALELWQFRNGFISERILRVTPDTAERALAILNALHTAAAKRGFKFENLNGTWEITMDVLSARFSVRERSAVDGRKRLAIVCGGSYSALFEVIDEGERLVENRLNDVFKRFYARVPKQRQALREAERSRQRAEELRILRVADEARRAEAARIAKEEEERRSALRIEAKHFEDAQRIRKYVDHVLAAAGKGRTEELQSWVLWATKVADDTDPTRHRTGSE